MLGKKFRPWGSCQWIISKLPPLKWSLLGCLSTEERSLEFLSSQSADFFNIVKFFDIVDPPSFEYDKIAKRIREQHRKSFSQLRNGDHELESHALLEDYPIIVSSVKNFISEVNENVIIDISSFPKRFFFPALRLLLDSEKIKNLLAIYTMPSSYGPGDLAEDPSDWYPLPLFMPELYPEPRVEMAIVGVGFLPFGLPELLKGKYRDVSIRLFFPFPPGPPNYQRTWDFVRKIEKEVGLDLPTQMTRLDALDTCDAFNHISSETNQGEKTTIFAPYGPKPISLAMCLYSRLTKSAVFYTQPKRYNPEYCLGVDESYAYCLRLNGRDLYQLN